MSDNESIDSLIYYKDVYKKQWGLPDWHERVKLRLKEEETCCLRFINWIEEWFNYDFSEKKVLVVGCGTGGEIINFHKKGAKVYGIEPNINALKISSIKASNFFIPKENISHNYSENLPYNDEEFDFIFCYTVLEHVNDVEISINEMVRCAKKNGHIFIETPDYRQLYEPHYKLPLPMFLPIWFNKIILRILKRPTRFLNTINKITSRKLQIIYQKLPVTAIRIYRNQQNIIPKNKLKLSYFVGVFQYIISRFFRIERNQIWMLYKTSNKKSNFVDK